MAFVVASDRWSRAGTLIHMKFLARGWPVLMIALVLAACGSSATGRDDPAYDGVLRYCERFAAAAPVRLIAAAAPVRLIDALGASYVAGNTRVVRTRLGGVVTRLSNTFQPSDSRFVAAWQCLFSISMNGQSCAGEVSD